MFEYFHSYFFVPKLNQWSLFMLLSSSLLLVLLYSNNKSITFKLDSFQITKKRKQKRMIEKVLNLFKDLERHERENNIVILMSDKILCERKIHQMIKDGSNYLQIISDFDRTMSSYMMDGQLNYTCHGVFETDPELSPEVKDICHELRDKYYPIEINTTLSDSEKIPFMIEWWSKAHDLMVTSRLHRHVLESTVRNCEVKLRNGCTEFVSQLYDYKIPLLIFSAGIGNVIEEILKHKQLLYDNVRIVSNFMNFNNDGILTGFQDEIIHTFNKSAKSIQDSEFYDNICTKRKNVILMGDSTGDPHMSDGLSDDANVLKIGFLNCNIENLKDKYMTIYDIVIVTDESFYVPQRILNCILNY